MEAFGADALVNTPWYILFATAFVFGGLHGLEPGHSKTLMAAFIIAVRGTVAQAIALGLAAATSHSIIVWVLGLSAAYFGEAMVPEEMEAWFVFVSGIIIVCIGAWMLIRLARPMRHGHHDHSHHADHSHNHSHHHSHHHHDHGHSHAHNDHSHDHHSHGHSHSHHADHSHAVHNHNHEDMSEEDMDAHARFHANEIKTKFASGKATMGQTILFGLSGGLIPCPAAITVLIICLHLDKLWLGFVMVSAFSAGLAVTMVAIGVISAVGVRTIRSKTNKFDAVFAKAPYLSGGLIMVIGAIMLYSGLTNLPL